MGDAVDPQGTPPPPGRRLRPCGGQAIGLPAFGFKHVGPLLNLFGSTSLMAAAWPPSHAAETPRSGARPGGRAARPPPLPAGAPPPTPSLCFTAVAAPQRGRPYSAPHPRGEAERLLPRPPRVWPAPWPTSLRASTTWRASAARSGAYRRARPACWATGWRSSCPPGGSWSTSTIARGGC